VPENLKMNQKTTCDMQQTAPDTQVQPKFIIRHYCQQDRDAVRRICCDTGFLGNPIDPLFEDRELFADYLTRYYTDKEPESSFVIEKGGEVRGYLLGSRKPIYNQLFNIYHNLWLFCCGLRRYFKMPYGEASRRFVHWIILNAWKEVPAAPKNTPHFHINLLPDVRSVAETHDLIQGFLDYLFECGEKSVYGQMVVFENRRSERMFARYGFKVMDRSVVTKYRELHSEPVYLFTVVKDLTINPRLYARVKKRKTSCGSQLDGDAEKKNI